jgi:hypothetical protein
VTASSLRFSSARTALPRMDAWILAAASSSAGEGPTKVLIFEKIEFALKILRSQKETDIKKKKKKKKQ